MTRPFPLILLSLALTGPLMSQPSEAVSVSVSPANIDIRAAGKLRLSEGRPSVQGLTAEESRARLRVTVDTAGEVVSFFGSAAGDLPQDPNAFLGLFFAGIPGYSRGVALWRYTPWRCWSKPMRIAAPGDLSSDDVQFFYWKYDDGLYGAAMPLSGNGYRSTLGQEGGRFGTKAVSAFDGRGRTRIPLMSVGFGSDPYRLFSALWEAGMRAMGRPENLRTKKDLPEVFDRIGWCTWNSSALGKNLNEGLLLKAAEYFRDAHFPVGWFLVDDGWFDQTAGTLNAFAPDPKKFPRGFREVIRELREKYHLKDVGVWHALNAYWRGINPSSPLGAEFRNDLIRYTELLHADRDTSTRVTCWFVSPAGDAPERFYGAFHRYLSGEGFSFVKVDNQLVVERMAPGNFPLWDGAKKYHEALNASVRRYFGNAIINCMDMTPDAWGNFGTTAVARTSEDYFPYEKGETYNLQRGNAAAHVLQAAYNALYFSQMVYPDFDLFQSHNPNAVFHAIARAANDGPVYITDNIGEGNFDVLRPLVYADGRVVRSDTPLLPAEGSLFQVQDPAPFRAFSRAGDAGVLAVWNCADAESVAGEFRPSDVHGLAGERFALYEHFSRELTIAGSGEAIRVVLPRLGYRLYAVIPLKEGQGVIGLVGKYNSPATVRSFEMRADGFRFALYEGGEFGAVAPRVPASVSAGGAEIPFTYRGGLILASVPSHGGPWETVVDIRF